MTTEYLQTDEIIKVAGHLEEKRGIYQMILSWTDGNNNRNRKSISKRLPVRGNKKLAESMLQKTRQEYVEILMQVQQKQEEAFALQEKERQTQSQEESSKT